MSQKSSLPQPTRPVSRADNSPVRVIEANEIWPTEAVRRMFVSRDLELWAYQRGVTLEFPRRGEPTDNAFIESFNRRSLRHSSCMHRAYSSSGGWDPHSSSKSVLNGLESRALQSLNHFRNGL